METNTYLILSALLYKITSLIVGTVSIFLGYKLFSKGIWGNSGSLETNFKNLKLVLRNAAPGTFFAVLGAVIICFTIIKGFNGQNEFSNINSEGEYTNTQLSTGEEEINPNPDEVNPFQDKPSLN